MSREARMLTELHIGCRSSEGAELHTGIWGHQRPGSTSLWAWLGVWEPRYLEVSAGGGACRDGVRWEEQQERRCQECLPGGGAEARRAWRKRGPPGGPFWKMGDAGAGSCADGRDPGRFLQLRAPSGFLSSGKRFLDVFPSLLPPDFPSWDDGH